MFFVTPNNAVHGYGAVRMPRRMTVLLWMLVTLLGHGLLVGGVFWADGAQHSSSASARTGFEFIAGDGDEDALQWIPLGVGADPRPKPILVETLANVMKATDVIRQLRQAADVVIDVRADEQSTEAAPTSELYGRYVGQINARVNRAWVRPRSAIGAPTFACNAQVSQDRSGNVQQVRLLRCNGSDRWQRSLVLAIESASPFPAPPDSKVFAANLNLFFAAKRFVAVDGGIGYEPEAENTVDHTLCDRARCNTVVPKRDERDDLR